MKVELETTVLYTCELNEADAKIVREYAEKYQYNLELAIWYCHQLGKIKLYSNAEAYDTTEKIISAKS